MSSIVNDTLPVFALFVPAFHPPTLARAQLLAAAALPPPSPGAQLLAIAATLTTGRRTVANLLRTVASLAQGDPASYHRVLSQAQWSGLRLACLLTRFLLRHCWPQGTVRLVGDDTVCEHPGRTVYG